MYSRKNNHVFIACIVALSLLMNMSVYGQNIGRVERIKVHGKSLEGNLSGDSADRYVSVYLPAGYKSNPTRRYPVVYFLHGYTDSDDKYLGDTKHWMKMAPVLDSVFAAKGAQEMIIVMPNAYTRFQGSMYSNSITTGNWEDYIAQELVAYIDKHYRTIAKSASRGLTGHSMGGYGAMRIGEKKPDVFSSIYLMSPCCLTQPLAPDMPPASLRIDSIRSFEELQNASFGAKIFFASAAAWSPNPERPPLYVDLPIKDGKIDSLVVAKWMANRPLITLDQYISNLKKLKAIGFDAGTRDRGIAASIKELDVQLNKYGIKHTFEIYEGDHINKIAERMATNMLVFFSKNLSFK